MRRAWAVLCLFGATGCPSLGAYQCERDEDCNRGGAEGRCLADAACAYPEESGRCESGWARSPNAADSPGACIDTEPPATSSSGGSSSTSEPATSGTTSIDPSQTSGTEASGTDGDAPCAVAEVEIATGTFSPGAGLSGFVLWMPLDAWPKGAMRLEAGDGLSIADANGMAVPYERRQLLDGTPALWVKLPAFDTDEVISLRFTFTPEGDGADPIAVWETSYVGVWHLDDAPMGLDGDISRNALVPEEPGMMQGSMQPEQQIEGPLGPALLFDGQDDFVEISASFQGQLDAYAVSMWIRADNPDIMSRGGFFQRLNGDYFYPRCWHGSDTSARLICQHSVSEDISSTSSPAALPVGEWLHTALVRDIETGITTLYLQGEPVGTITDVVGGTLDTDPEPRTFQVGYGEWGSLLGAIDEVRVSDRSLSPEHVRADYRSQRGELEIATYGPIEGITCPP
jgi:hypothetical protein